MTFMLVALVSWDADCRMLGVCYLFDEGTWRTALVVLRTAALFAGFFIQASAPDTDLAQRGRA
jgi:hypothetical protein